MDWLLQNSLSSMWLAMCRKHGWTPEVEADGTLARLEARRTEWQAKREAGEVPLTALMPLENGSERRWAYYLPQPIPEEAVRNAPETVRNLKILDPAVGSGHFLVIAFDLLTAFYREEARHRSEVDQERWSDRSIVDSILENNLHGIDLDSRAVQISAAALWLKAQQVCREVRPRQLNLVASNLHLGNLSDNDPALIELRQEVERETGIPAVLTDTVVHALKGAGHLGSLLKISSAVDAALNRYESAPLRLSEPLQLGIFGQITPQQQRLLIDRKDARVSLLDRLEEFLAHHTGGDDLGLRLWGQQFAAGVRFLRIMQEGAYDLVVGNPPYQGTSKMCDSKYIKGHYKLGKSDLYAAFLERGLQFARNGGVSALLTMRSWMFIKQYSNLRVSLLKEFDLRVLGDFDRGAFEEISGEVVAVVASIFYSAKPRENMSIAVQPTSRTDRSRGSQHTPRKRASTILHESLYSFDPRLFRMVSESPLLYWWPASMFQRYKELPKIGDITPGREGITTSDNARFRRYVWELSAAPGQSSWKPLIAGAAGRKWVEPVLEYVLWDNFGLEMKQLAGASIRNENFQLKLGVAFTTVGNDFGARLYRVPSLFEAKGRSVFPVKGVSRAALVCSMNRADSKWILESLNPSVDFTVGDVNRLPLFPAPESDTIITVIESAFAEHESHRETSLEFRSPGPSPWRHAQRWAQTAVDRPEGNPLALYEPSYDREPATDHLSFVFGCILGRFSPNERGFQDSTADALSHALPDGILFLDGSLETNDLRDGLGCSEARPLVDIWRTYGSDIDPESDLRSYLRMQFFENVHRQMYENRPTYWPLSSRDGTFVAWVSIHRFTSETLRLLLVDHVVPALVRIEGAINDLRGLQNNAHSKNIRDTEQQLEKLRKWRDELDHFIGQIRQCAEQGPAPLDSTHREREVNARYEPHLGDGVMVNSAALWPLLEPQWKDPKKWWKELALPQGKKDYDWSHLAMRYWPTRVDEKCQDDRSLGVAHGCFWKYHPARAWAWELRLQDEIGPGFRIEEGLYRGDGGSTEHRIVYLRNHAEEALEIVEKEALRRRRKHKRPQRELHLLEVGLWTAHPEWCWALEVRVSERQGVEFFLRSPDEPEAREAFEVAHPNRVREREELVSSLEAPADLFEAEEEHEGNGEDPEEDEEA